MPVHLDHAQCYDWDQLRCHKRILLCGRQGLGDHIVAWGLIHKLCEHFEQVHVVCRPHHVSTLHHMHAHDPRICVTPVPSQLLDRPHPDVIHALSEQLNAVYCEYGTHYVVNCWNQGRHVPWFHAFYEQFGFDYSDRYDQVHVPLPTPHALALYNKVVPQTPYVVTHLNSAERSHYPVDLFEARGSNHWNQMPVIPVVPGLTDNLFDWQLVLEQAAEIHVVSSSVFHLLQQLNHRLTGTVYFHDVREYTHINLERDINILGAHWKAIPYAHKYWK